MPDDLLVGRNPDPASKLPYLVRVPIDGGIVLKARECWPTTSRVYCHEVPGGWPEDAEVLEALEVHSCRRRGVAVDVVLARGRNRRSQFVFTALRGGRPAVFWQTAKTARSARPGARMPRRRASGQAALAVAVDTRERYPYTFAARDVTVERVALQAGDYAVLGGGGEVLGVVERKSLENLVAGLVDGSLAFQLAELSGVGRALLVVEGRYEALMGLEHVQPGFVLDLLARAQVRYPSVAIVFAGSRKHAEEYTYRWLGAVRADLA